MKQFLLYIVLCILFCSCNILKEPSPIKQMDFLLKGVRMIKKTEQIYYYGKKQPFVLDENAMFIPCKINDTTYLVYYDSDMSGMSIKHGFLQEKIPYNAELPQCNKKIKLKEKTDSNEKILIKSGLKYYDIASDFFLIKNLVGVAISMSNDTIISEHGSKKSPFTIGQDVLYNWANTMFLSFSDTTITLLDSNSLYDTTGFILIKSLFTCRGLTVCLTIDSIEYSFLFKTGSKGFLSLPQHVEHQEHSIWTNAITMGDLSSITGDILYSNKITHPVMGLAFISQFDWIIDIYKGKIYAKKFYNQK